MDRSLAAAPAPRRGGAPASPRLAPRSNGGAFGIPRPPDGAVRLARAGAAFAWRRRWLRVTLLAVVIASPLLAGGWLWLRQSSLVSVQRVQISGVHGPEAGAVEAALTQAAHRMSTLDVSVVALRRAVASFAVVRQVRAIPSFPHGLRIAVAEQLPVAALTTSARSQNGERTAVAADGVVLGPALLSSSLPHVSGFFAPAPGRRVSGPSLLAALAVLGAAPAPLARLVERVYTGPQGLTVAMRNGLLAYFGDASRSHAKWLSLARVLADPSSAGASYVDVRLPSHPAAGFPAGVTAPDASAVAAAGPGEQAGGGSESTIASLAAGLASGTAAATPAPAEPASTAAASSSPASGSEAASGAGAETSSGAEVEGSQTTAAPGG
jgi:cell division protein FtsQ